MVRVLLVDDNERFLRHARRFLDRQAHVRVVGTARRGKDGIAEAEALQPDVVLLDLTMPGQSGHHLIPQFKEALPGAKIVILTMHNEASYEEQALDWGADAFVSKQNMADALLPVIEQLVD